MLFLANLTELLLLALGLKPALRQQTGVNHAYNPGTMSSLQILYTIPFMIILICNRRMPEGSRRDHRYQNKGARDERIVE
jgi:hypothetical protein